MRSSPTSIQHNLFIDPEEQRPPLTGEVRAESQHFFREEILALQEVLAHDFSHSLHR